MSEKTTKERYRHLTLLHSNDLHGDFLVETVDEKLVGGVSMLSAYVNKVRETVPNSLYLIAGDMFRGSLIDSEFQGISTIEIMNALGPDVVSLGNHEVDYGIAHLLFLERCCRFPIVNANVYIKTMGTRLFRSHQVLEIGGMKILVIGILTEEIMGRAGKDRLLGTFVDVMDAVHEVGVICDSYQNTDIDLTILLTHIGFEKDIELARKLKPEWSVDVIVGGHSHTYLKEPAVENGILIVQAGIGTDQIGRFEIEVDTLTNTVHEWTWELVPIDPDHCGRNEALEDLILNYKRITDQKYGAVLTTLIRQATHPDRYRETSVGNLFCDILADNFGLDLVLIGSGSLRKEVLGPVVTKGNLLDMYSYDEKMMEVLLTGAEVKQAMTHMFRQAASDQDGGHSEYYQISRDFRFVWDTERGELKEALYKGRPIREEERLRTGLEGFHFDNLKNHLSLDPVAVEERRGPRLITANIRTVAEEYMLSHTHLIPVTEGRTERI